MTTLARADAILPRIGGGLVLAGVVAALLVGALAPAAAMSAVDGGYPCPFLAATGLPCPLCGMSHATLALGGGDVIGAFGWHPLFPLLLGFAAWGGWRLALGRPLSIAGHRISAMHLLCGTAVVWIVNIVARYV